MTDGRRHAGRRARRMLVVACGVLALVGGVLAGPTAASATVHRVKTTAVHGTVTLDGHPLAHVAVGTWSPTRGVLAKSRTDSRGHFTLHTIRGVTVYAYAGSAPSTAKAVFTLGSRHLVRGVIGAHAPKHLAGTIFQTLTPAKPSKLGGGHALKFRLQRAGRFSGSSAELAQSSGGTGWVYVEYGANTSGNPIESSVDGSFVSGWQVPGRYHLSWIAAPGKLSASSSVTVHAGTTTRAVAPRFSTGASIAVNVVQSPSGPNPGAPVAEVPASVMVPNLGGNPTAGDGTTSPSTSGNTGSNGQRVLTNVAAGTYSIGVGKYYWDASEGFVDPAHQPTSDDWLPASGFAQVGADLKDQIVTIAVDPAAHITGSIAPASADSSLQVVVENASGVPVRREDPPQRNTFDLGGLAAGTYTVTVIETGGPDTNPHFVTSAPVTVTTGQTVAVPGSLTPTLPLPTTSGTVSNATSGTVTAITPNVYFSDFYSFAKISKTGHYSLTTIPGVFPLTVATAGRVDSTTTVTVASTDTNVDLHAGDKLASVTARFTAHGFPVRVSAAATSPGVPRVFFNPSANGRSTDRSVVPARYRWDDSLPYPIASDGPWYYSTPTGSFTVRTGTNDLGTKQLAVLH